ncbi:MAG: VWA domain-containing protein [Thermoanaerobaculia bacterium]
MTPRLRRCSPGAAGLALGLLLAAVPVRAAGEPPAEQSFKESIEVSVVNLDVYVTDKRGEPLTGLKKEDFQVLEDGRPVEISNFYAESRGTALAVPAVSAGPVAGPGPAAPERPVSQRLRLVVFVDDVNLTQANRLRILHNVGKFLHAELKPGDEVMIVRYDQRLDIRRQFTPDLKAVDADLEEILKLPTDIRKYERSFNSALQSIGFSRLGGEPVGTLVEGQIASWAGEESIMVQGALDALDSVVSWLAGVPGRKAILYVSDGLPLTPGLDLYTIYSRAPQSAEATKRISEMSAQKFDMTARFRQLTSHASRNRVAFYPIEAYGTRNSEGSLFDSVSLAVRQAGLRFLAEDTGGRALVNAADVPAALARVSEDFGTYYSLGYQPRRPGDEAEHKIEVKVKARGAQVRYRQWYRDKPVGETVAEGTLAVMRFGPEDNPLGAKLEVVPNGKKPGETLVRIQVPVGKLFLQPNGESRQGQLRLYVVASGQGSTTPVRQTKLVTVEVPEVEAAVGSKKEYTHEIAIPLKPGYYALGVGVRDELTATTSYLRREIEIGVAKK